MAVFKGAATALVTPFKEDGSVNYKKLEELLDYQIANNIDAVVVCATTGEAPTLELDEHYEVIRHAVKYVNHRIPVIAGSGSNSTATAINTSKQAALAGADGLLCVTPYYNRCTQKGLIADFTQIAHATDLPVILYNVPGRTSVNLLPKTAAELFYTVDNIVGIKEASGNISQAAQIMHLTNGEMDLYSGNDDQIIPMMALGGLGVISVLSNVAPQATHDMTWAFLNGEFEKARDMQIKAIPLIEQLFIEVNPIPAKAALNLMGLDVGPMRLPLTEIEDEHRQTLKKAMQEFGILD